MAIVHVSQEALIRLETAAEPYNPQQQVALALTDLLIPDRDRTCQLHIELPDALQGAALELAAANQISVDQLIDHAIKIRY